MDITSLIGPWLSLLLVLGPLFVAERWIHQHSYGVGYLLTGDKGAATGFYYLVFFPGVFLHEFTQYLVAGILNVPLKKLEPRLQEQDNGTLRYDFVTIDTKKTDTLKASIIGGVPFILAGFLVYYISTAILDLHILLEALGTYDLPTITSALQAQFNTPDFWFWLYILFAISNGMIPTKEDRAGWGLIVVVIGVISLAFLVIGLDDVLVETLDGPVREGLQTVTTILSIILVLDFTAILILGITEDTLERMRGFKMDYSGNTRASQQPKARPPGSNLPLPKGELMPSVYNIHLPIPPLPPKRDPQAAMKRAAADVASGRPPAPATAAHSPTSGGESSPERRPSPPPRPDTATPSPRTQPQGPTSQAGAQRPPSGSRAVPRQPDETQGQDRPFPSGRPTSAPQPSFASQRQGTGPLRSEADSAEGGTATAPPSAARPARDSQFTRSQPPPQRPATDRFQRPGPGQEDTREGSPTGPVFPQRGSGPPRATGNPPQERRAFPDRSSQAPNPFRTARAEHEDDDET